VSDADFDFWLGRWDVRWGSDGRGTNRIRKILGDRVILEQFDGSPGTSLQGMSFSVFDSVDHRWRQTWVDNDGNYLAFDGGLREDGAMELRGMRAGELVRMLWLDIEGESLRWLWERSPDGGKTWETLWELAYARVAPADVHLLQVL
jgi:hypothetical protein